MHLRNIYNEYITRRAQVLGYFEELEDSPDSDEYRIIDEEGVDIFGQPKEVSTVIFCLELVPCP